MLRKKKILVFGNSAEITLTIIEKLIQQGAIVNFISTEYVETPIKTHKFLVANYHDNKEIELLISQHLNDIFNGIIYSGGKGGARPLTLSNANFVQTMFQQNIFSFFEIIRLLLKKRCIAEGASIIGLSSVSSIKGLKSKTVYSASKAALDAAVRGMAAELAEKKIRVNSIQKGWVRSDMNLDFIKNNIILSAENDLDKQFLGVIEPEEIGNLVAFLMSDAVKTLTGTNILLDGGYTL